MSLGHESGGLCTYNVGFYGYPSYDLSASNVDRSPVAVEVLESYNMGGCTEYPSEPSTSMSSIFIAADGVAVPSPVDWNLTAQNGSCNEQMTITSSANPGGSVEIHY